MLTNLNAGSWMTMSPLASGGPLMIYKGPDGQSLPEPRKCVVHFYDFEETDTERSGFPKVTRPVCGKGLI